MNNTLEFGRETNWFAVQTKPYGESTAAAHVARLDLEVFLPKLRQSRLVCGVRRTVTKALFPGYFFACFSPSLSLSAVRCTPGVARVVGTVRYPIPLASEIIESLRERGGSDGVIQFQPKTLRPGDRVKIEGGPFSGWIGRVERESDDHRRVTILLEALHAARILVEPECLESVAGTA